MIGRIDAISVETGRTAWVHEQRAGILGSVLAVAGGVVFSGDVARRFMALDDARGKVLWQTVLSGPVSGHAISYAVDGRQYIAVPAGGDTASPEKRVLSLHPEIKPPQGQNAIFVFALPPSAETHEHCTDGELGRWRACRRFADWRRCYETHGSRARPLRRPPCRTDGLTISFEGEAMKQSAPARDSRRPRARCGGCTDTGGQAAPASASAVDEALDPAFEQFVDRYLAEVRGVGGNLPADMSAASFTQRLETQRALVRDLEKIDRSKLTFEQDIDFQMLQGTLMANVREEEQVQRWRQDPRRYVETNPITFKLQADPASPRGARAGARQRHEDAAGAHRQRQDQPDAVHAEVAALRQRAHRRHHPALSECCSRVCGAPEPGAAARELQAETEKAVAALTRLPDVRQRRVDQAARGRFQDRRRAVQLPAGNTGTCSTATTSTCGRSAAAPPGFTRVPGYFDWGWKQYRIVEKLLEARAEQIDPTRPGCRSSRT